MEGKGRGSCLGTPLPSSACLPRGHLGWGALGSVYLRGMPKAF